MPTDLETDLGQELLNTPIVMSFYRLVRSGKLSERDALIGMVKELAAQKKILTDLLIEREMKRSTPYVIIAK